ncbi:MAG TPA: DUF547 domain-containing protein [Thermoanaerobaculia bacterium]|nr:DUF547 domain-containing protein [Thermoanaerobaculia bacterium]
MTIAQSPEPLVRLPPVNLRPIIAAAAILMVSSSPPLPAAEPGYAVWNGLLNRYYHPDHGMDYGSLQAHDRPPLQQVQRMLAGVDVSSLTAQEQLAYWINLYNVSVVALVVEHYPIRSIRDLSTDPFIRLNVFKKKRVHAGGILMSLDEIEHEKIRKPFRDPRIHFAINCAAKSCPPILGEAFVGSRIDEQLDDQVRRFAAGGGLRVASRGGTTTVTTTKIMKWFADDFDRWSGGAIAFLRRYMPPEKLRIVTGARDVEIEFDDYDWSLNDWKLRP